MHMAAAVPAACPITLHVPMTRVVPNATWLTLMFRPASSRLPTLRE